MVAAYDLFVKVFEDGMLNDEFEGFKVIRKVNTPHALKVELCVRLIVILYLYV